MFIIDYIIINSKGVDMAEKEQLIISIEADKKQEFRIACICDKTDMTAKLTELIDKYLIERK